MTVWEIVSPYIQINLDIVSAYNWVKKDIEGFVIDSKSKTIFYGDTKNQLVAYSTLLSGNDSSSSLSKMHTGLMVDCARNAVPKIETLKRMGCHLALLGYDFLGLYLEDLIEVEGYPLFGYQRGRYSIVELKELDAFLHSIGLYVKPYIQTLAHLPHAFRHYEFDSIRDIDDILLIDSDETYRFIDSYFKACKKAFRTNQINIGMDEAYKVGLGKHLDQHGFESRIDMMVRHLNKVVEIGKSHGYHMEMWADMFFELAQGGYHGKASSFDSKLKDSISKDIELVYWDYYSKDESHYDAKFESLKTLTDQVGFAGGAWKWMGFVPLNSFSISTLKPALKSALKFNVKNFTLTAWGDNGAEASIYSILPTIYTFSSLLNPALSSNKLIYEYTGYWLNTYLKLDLPNNLNKDLQAVNPSKYLLYEDLLIGNRYFEYNLGFKSYYENLYRVFKRIDKTSYYGYNFQVIEALVRILKLKSTLSVGIYESYHNNDLNTLKNITYYRIPNLIRNVDTFYEVFKASWLKENKSFGLEIHTVRIGGLLLRLKDIQLELTKFLQTGSKILALEMRDKPLISSDKARLGYHNEYQKMISYSSI